MKKIPLLFISLVFVITACSSMTVSEKESKRKELDDMAARAIAGLVEKDASLQQQLDQSPAYAAANMKVTRVPIVGAGVGEGLSVNKETQQRTCFTVSRFDIGGWGVRSC